MAIDRNGVEQALRGVIDPDTGRELLSGATLRRLDIQGDEVEIEIEIDHPAASRFPEIRRALVAALRRLPGVGNVQASLGSRIASTGGRDGTPPVPGISNVIAVGSGKGGVGKSTTAVNLALALAAEGARVGLLDADIHGPSLPMMMGIQGRPESDDGRTMDPLVNHGLQVMSIGFLVDPDEAMVWRGAMAVQALEQLLRQTRWRDLDYLIVDLPPGTGDIQLSLSQRVPLAGAVIVTTPQDLALLDARKAVRMFEKVGVPILGVVENMAVHVCSQCGHGEHIFGSGGGQRLAADFGLPYLGALPLAMTIRMQADGGLPTVIAEPDGAIARSYAQVARSVAIAVADRARSAGALLPEILFSEDT